MGRYLKEKAITLQPVSIGLDYPQLDDAEKDE